MQKHTLITACLLFVFAVIQGQNIDELERRNGFKDIKLGMHIDSLDAEVKLRREFLEQNEFPAKLHTISGPAFANVGEVAIRKIEVKTYKDQIYEIQVLTEKDPRLMRALESVYGQSVYDMKNQSYFWKGNTLVLKFGAYARNQLELLFISYVLLEQMKADKEKKVDEIADDF